MKEAESIALSWRMPRAEKTIKKWNYNHPSSLFFVTCYEFWLREEKLNGICTVCKGVAILFSPFSLYAPVYDD